MRYTSVTSTVQREDDQFVALCEELDISSCGRTEAEAIENVKEALVLYLNALEELGECEEVLKERKVAIHEREDAPETGRIVRRDGKPASSHQVASIYAGDVFLGAACSCASGFSFQASRS